MLTVEQLMLSTTATALAPRSAQPVSSTAPAGNTIIQRPVQPVQPAPSATGNAIAPRQTPRPLPRNVLPKQQPAAPSPGRFQHPQMTEIAKRRAANSFTAKNIQTILLNTALVVASFVGSSTVHPMYVAHISKVQRETLIACRLTKVVETISIDQLPVAIDASRILLLLRFLLLANVLFALRPALPYFNKPDQLNDIALTPSQRALLGLLPSQPSTPRTPAYVTPPRYVRSSPLLNTSQANQSPDRRSVSVNYTPQSTPRFSPGASQQQAPATPSRRLSGSPFTSSPLFNKALANSTSQNTNPYSQADFTESTRSLLAGRESTVFFPGGSLRRSQSMREPGTPSPGAKERTKVKLEPGLNYKWLYEKGLKVGKNGSIEY